MASGKVQTLEYMGHVRKSNIASGGSVTIKLNSMPALVICSRAAAGAHTTTAFIDQWDGVTYIENNSSCTLSVDSNDNLTITNNGTVVYNYMIIY